MANPTDGSGKGPQKPTPIIDLKATEVKVDDAAKAAAGKTSTSSPTPPGQTGSGQSASGQSASGQATPGKPAATDMKSGAPQSGSTASGIPNIGAGRPAAPQTGATTATTAAAGQDAAKSAKPTAVQPDQAKKADTGKATASSTPPASDSAARSEPRRSGGFVSTLTHMVAGLAGGVLALFGAETIQNQLGVPLNLPHSKAEQTAADLAKRVAAVETSTRQGGATTEKLAAAERRIAELEQSSKIIGDIKTAQATLIADTKALEGKITTVAKGPPLSVELTNRLGKLEQSIQTLASAAGPDGKGGGSIAQLAGISGKLSDLEGSVATQLAALRKSVTTELETRVAQIAEASEAAKAGTQRLDRDVATLKTDAARLQQRDESLRATDERFDKTLRVVQEETGTLKSALDGLKGDVTQQLTSVARPKDLETALAPVSQKIATIEKELSSVVKSETDRKSNAERIVLALELANLKRVVERGSGFAKELGELKATAGAKLNLSALEKFKDKGVSTTNELSAEFRSIAHQVIAAADETTDASMVDRLLTGAKSIVRVRTTNPAAGDTSAEATVARIEARLKEGSLAAALEEASKLPAKAKTPAAGWLDRVAARAEIEKAIAALESQLKASIGGGAASNTKG